MTGSNEPGSGGVRTPSTRKGLFVVGRGERMGLGSMTEDFCLGMRPEAVIILDVGRTVRVPFEYTEAGIQVSVVPFRRFRDGNVLRSLLHGAKIVVGFETFYVDWFVSMVQRMRGKTVLFPMWEWSPVYSLRADLLINLSRTDQEWHPSGLRYPYWPRSPLVRPANGLNRVIHWPPKTFLHLAGNAIHNREGTKQVLTAAKYLKGTGAKLVVRSSFDVRRLGVEIDPEAPLELLPSTDSRRDLFTDCDCLVAPRRLPGHSLPINEAAGEGISCLVLDLPDWAEFPYRIPAVPQPHERWGKVQQAPVWAADPDVLGKMLRNLALGNTDPLPVPGPTLPTWDDFRSWWETEVEGRLL
jgi:hypothetical protein